jgi:hypothetical protein
MNIGELLGHQGNGWKRQGMTRRNFNKAAKTKRRRAIAKASRHRNRPVKRPASCLHAFACAHFVAMMNES